MTHRIALTALLGLVACSEPEDVCFEQSTREYVAAKQLIAEARSAAETGFTVTPERVDFLDVSECGPTLEDREICTTQSSKTLPGFALADTETAAKLAETLTEQLPELEARARRAYQVCLLNGPVG